MKTLETSWEAAVRRPEHSQEGAPLKGAGEFGVSVWPCASTRPGVVLLGGSLPCPWVQTEERTPGPVFWLAMGIVFVPPDSEHYWNPWLSFLAEKKGEHCSILELQRVCISVNRYWGSKRLWALEKKQGQAARVVKTDKSTHTAQRKHISRKVLRALRTFSQTDY